MTFYEKLMGRNMAWAAGAGLLLLTGCAVIVPIAALFSAQEEDLKETAQDIADYRARLSHLPALSQQAVEFQDRARNVSGLLIADDAATAAGILQRTIESLIANQAGEIRSTNLLDPEPVDGFEKITIENDFALSVNAFADLLYALESTEPYLFISSLEMTAPRDWDRAIENREEPRLQIEWSVYAYRWDAAS